MEKLSTGGVSINKKVLLAGACAGAVNGFFGSGGGMVLVPLLEKEVEDEKLFPTSLRIMVPVCLVSLGINGGPLPWKEAAPYLAGSLAGGLLAGRVKVPALWLHRLLGGLILLGGGRMLWS